MKIELSRWDVKRLVTLLDDATRLHTMLRDVTILRSDLDAAEKRKSLARSLRRQDHATYYKHMIEAELDRNDD